MSQASRTGHPGGIGRTVIVGDVHGCADELGRLLEKVHFGAGDRLIFVGDLVAKGPDSRGVLDIARQKGALIVRGNHEEKILQWRAAERAGHPDKVPLGKAHREVVERMRPIDWTLIETAPLSIDLPEHEARVVHAGVEPGLPWDEQKPDTLMRIRTVKGGKASDRGVEKAPAGKTAQLWGELYKGPPHVIFGHNAAPGLQLHPWATGLDTGCVYGGRLTCLVLAAGEPVPLDLDARRRLLVSENAAHAYSEVFPHPSEPPRG